MFHISTIYARLVLRELETDGIATAPFLLRLGFDEGALWRDETMPAADFQGLLAFALVASGDPGLGLRMGSHCQPAVLGELGLACLSAPTLLDGLRAFADFSHLHTHYIKTTVETIGDTVTISAASDLPAGVTVRSQLELFTLITQQLIEVVILRPLTEAQCRFTFSEPEYAARYQQHFHSPVHFDQHSSSLHIPLALGSVRSATANPVLWEQTQKRCRQLLEARAAQGTPYSDHVRRRLQGAPAPPPGQRDIAGELHMTERTLVRKLNQEHSQFRHLSQEILRKHAEQALMTSDISVEALSRELGYRDSANFRRAFRRWHKQSPQQYRNQAVE